MGRRPSAAEAVANARRRQSVDDRAVTGAGEITTRQSIIPVSLVTILFFMWGFAYGLLDVLNKHFQETLHISAAQAAGLQGAYFGAYFIGPLTYSGWIVRKFGYRWTFITGLTIYGIGALLFWPSGMKRSFGGFCGSMFVVGSGLSTLETSANPFIATCGPPKWSELRLNLAQAFQAIGSVVAPVLASFVIFKGIHGEDKNSLQSVQWVYLGIACFVFLLAIVFFFAPIPEVTDADMAEQSEQAAASTGYQDKPLSRQYTLFWGTIAQFCYVGSQVAIAGYFIHYCVEVKPSLSSADGANLLAVAQALFAVGRFSAALLMKYVRPRLILLAFMTGIVIFISAAIGTYGNTAIAMLSLVLFFESCIFPTIFTLSLRGLGRHTKRGASFLVASVSGGAVFPPMLGAVVDAKNTRIAMAVPLAGFLVAYSFPVYLNLFKAQELDAFNETNIGVETPVEKVGEVEQFSGKDVEAGKIERVSSRQ
ncbi:putative L-fucose-proton symporter [Trematosphaeria pertusa]|uniref:Putative L-fucose-proton symporter n=1 Tax=Trematosphaeria pertusa TaxID=390896 RepID=A0A6A6IYL5_9PLEO|nr:putative L-fucose-proton symporter [Trematosphaeria pertusa]KAF2255012.1 putative L-fucose-proton symporter [Trematosphaeria pertusa]